MKGRTSFFQLFFLALLFAGRLLHAQPGDSIHFARDTSYSLTIPDFHGPHDEINDVWTVSYKGPPLQSFHVAIYDRWGTMLYESKDLHFTWDGKTSNGVTLEEGVYVYLITIHPKGLSKKEYKGTLTIYPR